MLLQRRRALLRSALLVSVRFFQYFACRHFRHARVFAVAVIASHGSPFAEILFVFTFAADGIFADMKRDGAIACASFARLLILISCRRFAMPLAAD